MIASLVAAAIRAVAFWASHPNVRIASIFAVAGVVCVAGLWQLAIVLGLAVPVLVAASLFEGWLMGAASQANVIARMREELQQQGETLEVVVSQRDWALSNWVRSSENITRSVVIGTVERKDWESN